MSIESTVLLWLRSALRNRKTNRRAKAARARINHMVEEGLIPKAQSLPCSDCGHYGLDVEHEYDHWLGYAPVHYEDVQPVCLPCHTQRERLKRLGRYTPKVADANLARLQYEQRAQFIAECVEMGRNLKV